MNDAYRHESYGVKDRLAASLAGGRYFWAGYAPWKDNHCTKPIVSLGDHLWTNQSCQGMRPETTIHSEQRRLFFAWPALVEPLAVGKANLRYV